MIAHFRSMVPGESSMPPIRRPFRPQLETLESRTVPYAVASYGQTILSQEATGGVWTVASNGVVLLGAGPGDEHAVPIAVGAPSQVAIDKVGNILADFDSKGLWFYQPSRQWWWRVTTLDPVVLASGDHYRFFAAFAGYGLYWYSFQGLGSFGSERLSEIAPTRIDAAGDNALVADYDIYGVNVWQWLIPEPNGGRWTRISDADPQDVALTLYTDFVGGQPWTGYSLAVDFGTSGLWLWRNEVAEGTGPLFVGGEAGLAHRILLTASDPYEIDVGFRGNVAAAFHGYGLLRYDLAAGWSTVYDSSVIGVEVVGIHYGVERYYPYPADDILYAHYPGYYLQAYFVPWRSFAVLRPGTPTAWAMI